MLPGSPIIWILVLLMSAQPQTQIRFPYVFVIVYEVLIYGKIMACCCYESRSHA
jgi:hypothetical protein